ncbi:MAG: S9 family peptidase [Halieaceae bacterium]|jgi:dipeptidyl aminopeptidase/acylaminoacyl peptidase|nr:S9 family peptidase [Halieaceae bacterium]
MLRFIAASLLMSLAAGEVAADPYPLDYWARRDAVTGVSLSPDGSQFALTRILERGGNPIIELYDSDNLDKDPVRIDSSPMEIMPGIRWIDDNVFLFGTRQQVREQIKGFNQGTYKRQNVKYDGSAKKPIDRIRQDYFSVEGLLPNKKNKILISVQEGVPDGMQSGGSTIRPRAYYEYDLKRNRKKLLMRGKIALGNIQFDQDGNATHAFGYDIRTNEYTYHWRPKGTKDWEEMYRLHRDSFETFRPISPDPVADNHFLVIAHNGYDKSGLWSFDAKNQKFSEALYRRNDVDSGGTFGHSNRLSNGDDIAGVVWCKDECYREFFDPNEEALYRQLESIIPNADKIYITGRSQDGNTLIVANLSPRDPGTYYLIRNGRVSKISGRKPYLEYDQLADVNYVTYKARDGRDIGGYLTVPNGDGPFPLIVMPHGGPYVSETTDTFDEWSQMLANNGYMVFQPQYRGSKKYGLEFYKSAFINGSEAGHAMQDDKDDGALYLAKQGLVDPDRMAMFGWSYGGYAALVAASREDQIYQCVIAGAAVTDPEMQVDYYRYRMEGAQKLEQLTTWDGAISPINEVTKVNVPLYILHGDNDQRVPPEHYYKYVKELEKEKIPHKKVLLEGADHFGNTLFYRHKMTLYKSMLEFLADDCGLKNEAMNVASVEVSKAPDSQDLSTDIPRQNLQKVTASSISRIFD